MKKIFKYMAIVAMGAVMASCNKAEYKTANFVSFDSGRAMMPEACGIYEIPVSLYNADASIVTYMVTEGSAKQGVDYVIVNKDGVADPSGVLSLKKGSENFIYVKVTDRTGELTKNLTFTIDLVATATDGVVLGATSSCACTIIDSDAGINLLIGSWYGKGTSVKDTENDLAFNLDVLDPDSAAGKEAAENYPDANVVLTNLSLNNGDMESQSGVNIFAFYDENTSELRIYNNQFYNAYNFGEELGPCFVGLASDANDDNGTIDFIVGDGELVSTGEFRTWLYNYETGAPNGYYYSTTSYKEVTLHKTE